MTAPFDQLDFYVPPASPSGSPAEAPTVNLVDGVLSNLIAARELISDEDRWLQRAYCMGDSYCALGAVRKAARTNSDENPTTTYLMAVMHAADIYQGFVCGFNDRPTTTHADVLALFDRAISARRAELSQRVSAPS